MDAFEQVMVSLALNAYGVMLVTVALQFIGGTK